MMTDRHLDLIGMYVDAYILDLSLGNIEHFPWNDEAEYDAILEQLICVSWHEELT